ncbi:VOC family protein [Labedella endophytica]|uniref:VOC family protein n=1 Tax=Labedella endophytica TaxID=1523160 RepID=A0A433JVX2_9MICO|nr:VOC family protein [Labedella endophytica]RUR03123.1 VOC family protein [Labedella endophytica]
MSVTVTTHLNFTGTARAALEFYAQAFGGHTTISTYGDFGMPAGLPDTDKVVFGLVVAPNGFSVMAYDIPGSDEPRPAGTTRRENGTTITDEPFFVSLGGETLEEVSTYWDALVDGAIIVEPLAASAWSAGFGMLTDRFGVTWSVSVVAPRD